MRKLTWVLVTASLLAGCATTNYANKAMSINMGMSKAQVVALMGPPKKSSARKIPEGLVERYSWWSPKVIGFTPIDNEMLASDRVSVVFENGKVVEWGDKYDFADSIDKSREIQAEMIKSLPQPNMNITVQSTHKPQ
jgi:major membrane immunogen (membrane-anchored lipoprotein)